MSAEILPFTSPTQLPENLAELQRYTRMRKPTQLDDLSALAALEAAVFALRRRHRDSPISFALKCAAQHLDLAYQLAHAQAYPEGEP